MIPAIPYTTSNTHRILIVDDHPRVASSLQIGLERLPNCEVCVATGGEQALRLFEQQPFDLLITDYQMPDTDGLTLATHIRQLYPQTIIFVFTAHDSPTMREQASRIPIHRIIGKPTTLREVRQAVLAALGIDEQQLLIQTDGPGHIISVRDRSLL
ncbi:MAG TPA: response regulator [Chloroflexi bacterium]|nr:response regulator [Chloroflexota bacterium]